MDGHDFLEQEEEKEKSIWNEHTLKDVEMSTWKQNPSRLPLLKNSQLQTWILSQIWAAALSSGH